MRIDLKSFLLGVILVFALFITIGQSNKQNFPVGRFQMYMQNIGSGEQKPYLLDTKSGNLWVHITVADSDREGWITEGVLDTNWAKIWMRELYAY